MVAKVFVLSMNGNEEAQEMGQLDEGHLGVDRTDP